jgi:hypothetical protein
MHDRAVIALDPPAGAWPALLEPPTHQELLARPLADWRREFRAALGLPRGSPIIATGHQALFWHPGILAKYLAVEAFTARRSAAPAHLVVDQHVEGFGSFEAPVRLGDGTLAVRRIELTAQRRGVPIGLHDSFTPRPLPAGFPAALAEVDLGVRRIFEAVNAHRDAPNAAMQLTAAMSDLMSPWVREAPAVTSSMMLETPLARALLETMAGDPSTCADCYNTASAACPEAGVSPLLIRDEYVELPLWRARPTGERIRAYDSDVQLWLEDPARAPRLFPRALLLTALVRLGFCDVFVHGTGGARYDQAMERWVQMWLGVAPAPKVVATATLRLALAEDGPLPDERAVAAAVAARRRAWHDPESLDSSSRLDPGPGRSKRELLAAVEESPRRSRQRGDRFRFMHERIAHLRERNRAALGEVARDAEIVQRRWRERPIMERRTWPFPLYGRAAIDALAAAIDEAFAAIGR